jgi:hypothetical protein
MIGVQGRIDQEVTPVLEFIARTPLDPQHAFPILYSLGEGLRWNRSSLALADKDASLVPFFDQAFRIALDQSAAEPLQMDAIRLLSVSPYTLESNADLFLLKLGSGESQAVQSAIIALLARFNNRQVAPSMMARWPVLSPVLQKQAVSALLEREDRVPLVLAALQDGRIWTTNFSSVQMDFLRTHRDLNTRQQHFVLNWPFFP